MWRLETAGQVTLAIPNRGLRIGRREDCDVLLNDGHASSLHCVVIPSQKGLELLALGRNPTQVNDKPVEGRALLESGDRVELPGLRFVVRGQSLRRVAWVLEHGDLRVTLGLETFTIGGGRYDHLHIVDWPANAVEVNLIQGQPVAEIRAGMSLHHELAQPTIEQLVDGDTLSFGPGVVRLRAVAADNAPTLRVAVLPVRAHFTFLPTGGLLQLGFSDGARADVELPELRARLVAALLGPPKEYDAGELIPDDLLLRLVWPGRSDRDRTDLNTLVHRARRELLRAGVNPTPILVRARGGGATRFRLAPGADVAVL